MKNFLMISPQYPPRVYMFIQRLKAAGFNVIGLGEQNHSHMDSEVRKVLDKEHFFKVPKHEDHYKPNVDMREPIYEEYKNETKIIQATFGKLEYVESFNEYWLPLEAKLREDFSVEGPKPAELETWIKKSKMKPVFEKSDAKVVPGEIIYSLDQLFSFWNSHEHDIIIKPDRGVGSSSTERLRTEHDIEKFYMNKKSEIPYFAETFIKGDDKELVSFDGLTDKDGNVAFYTLHRYLYPDLYANNYPIIAYWNSKKEEIPEKIKKIGLDTVKNFGLKKRFFHIEYFRVGNDYYGMELNARPPGMLHLDMINYANGIDIWDEYAHIANNKDVVVQPKNNKVCTHFGRWMHWKYMHSDSEFSSKYEKFVRLRCNLRNNLLGDSGCVVLTNNHDLRIEMQDFMRVLV